MNESVNKQDMSKENTRKQKANELSKLLDQAEVLYEKLEKWIDKNMPNSVIYEMVKGEGITPKMFRREVFENICRSDYINFRCASWYSISLIKPYSIKFDLEYEPPDIDYPHGGCIVRGCMYCGSPLCSQHSKEINKNDIKKLERKKDKRALKQLRAKVIKARKLLRKLRTFGICKDKLIFDMELSDKIYRLEFVKTQ